MSNARNAATNTNAEQATSLTKLERVKMSSWLERLAHYAENLKSLIRPSTPTTLRFLGIESWSVNWPTLGHSQDAGM